MKIVRRILVLLACALNVQAFSGLRGITVNPVKGGDAVNLEQYLKNPNGKTLLIFGTYAADFNAIEYLQRLRHYIPRLKESGVSKFGVVLNCQPEAALAVAEMVDLDTSAVDIFVDNEGVAGKKFGVNTGWLKDNEDVSPYVKLFGMLFGLGAWATLPAVIGGYIGNPFLPQPWIEDALAVGQRKGRWPDTALEIGEDGSIVNKFDELPVVGDWPRRPLELATLRLQSMVGISIQNWSELAPDDQALQAGVLTQLGGCLVTDSDGQTLFERKDTGICAVTNFEILLKKIAM